MYETEREKIVVADCPDFDSSVRVCYLKCASLLPKVCVCEWVCVRVHAFMIKRMKKSHIAHIKEKRRQDSVLVGERKRQTERGGIEIKR